MSAPLSPFANEPILVLRRAPVRAQLADAPAALDARMPLRVLPLLQGPAERNELRHAPRRATAWIRPANFPLAIPAGMTAAALATGNPFVLKPAEQSPACALELVTALREAGVPANALALLP